MAVYIYSVVAATHPLKLDGLGGVGAEPTELRTVTCGDLTAVVSDAPTDLRPKRRDLVAHQSVQERLMSEGTVLPLRFGLTAADDEAVRAALEQRAEPYVERLRALEGCAEYHLRGLYDQEDLLRRILQESDQARALNDVIRAGRGSPDQPLALGRLVAEEARTRQEALAAQAVEALRGLADDERVSEPTGQDFLNVSFLVHHGREEAFLAAEQKLSSELGEGVDLRLHGPLPAYSFV